MTACLEMRVQWLEAEVRRLSVSTCNSPASSSADVSHAISAKEIWLAADGARRAVELRHETFPASAQEEPAFMMLLAAQTARLEGKRLSVTAIASLGFVPGTTGLRYLNLLVEDGLLRREIDANDRRRSWIHTTARAEGLIGRYAASVKSASQPHRMPRHLADESSVP